MEIVDQIKTNLRKAMKNKDKASLLAYRGVLSAIHNKEIELKHKLNDEETIAVLNSQAKQREDSITEFKKGGREDLVAKEKKELELISNYLPEKMSKEEIKKMVDKAIKITGAKTMQDMGRVMGEIMKKGKRQVDGEVASKIVKQKLSP